MQRPGFLGAEIFLIKLIRNETPTQVFLYKFCGIFKKTILMEHLLFLKNCCFLF